MIEDKEEKCAKHKIKKRMDEKWRKKEKKKTYTCKQSVVATQHKSIVYHSIIHNDRDARRYPIGFGCFVIMIDYSLFYASRWWCIFIISVLSPCCFAFSFACLPAVVSALLFLLTVISDLLSPLLSPLLAIISTLPYPAHCCSDHVMIVWFPVPWFCLCMLCSACMCMFSSSLSFFTSHPSFSLSCALHTSLLSLSSIICSHRYGIIVGHICVPFSLYLYIVFQRLISSC